MSVGLAYHSVSGDVRLELARELITGLFMFPTQVHYQSQMSFSS